MSSKVHFHGGPIAFFDCTKPAGKFFHRFSNFNQSWGAFLPNQPFFEIISSSLSKGCLICLHILSLWPYPRSNNPKDYCLVILEATGLFLDAALRYGFFQKILNKITDMARYNILNEDRGRPESFCLSMVPNASNLLISCFTEVLCHCFSRLFFHILYAA